MERDMWRNAHDAYLESRVLSADPLELIRLLYQACTNSVRDARQYLANGDIRGRSAAITKACRILTELTVALDRQRGGQISERLGDLYEYMTRRLTEANFQQMEAPLVEVLGLLATLTEAWEGVQQQIRPATSVAAPVAAAPWNQPAMQESHAAYASQSWSF